MSLKISKLAQILDPEAFAPITPYPDNEAAEKLQHQEKSVRRDIARSYAKRALDAGVLLPQPPPNYAVAPGEWIKEWLEEYELTQSALAKRMGISRQRLNGLVNGTVGLSYDMAEKLSEEIGIPAESWMRYEVHYQLALRRLAGLLREAATTHQDPPDGAANL